MCSVVEELLVCLEGCCVAVGGSLGGTPYYRVLQILLHLNRD
jgi:hypothetical protein